MLQQSGVGQNVLAVADTAAKLETSKGQVYVARSRVMNLLKQIIQRSQFDSEIIEGRP